MILTKTNDKQIQHECSLVMAYLWSLFSDGVSTTAMIGSTDVKSKFISLKLKQNVRKSVKLLYSDEKNIPLIEVVKTWKSTSEDVSLVAVDSESPSDSILHDEDAKLLKYDCRHRGYFVEPFLSSTSEVTQHLNPNLG